MLPARGERLCYLREVRDCVTCNTVLPELRGERLC